MIAGAAIAGAGKKAFDYASDTNEALNKVEVAFGDNKSCGRLVEVHTD